MFSPRHQPRPRSAARLYVLALILASTVVSLLLGYFTLFSSLSMSSFSPSSSPPRVILISTTSYSSLTDLRFRLALRTAAQARLHSIPFLVVDSSPEPLKAALRSEGALVLPDDPSQPLPPGKGFAYRLGIREALRRAPTLLSPASSDFALCISEPEKVDFVRLLPRLSSIMLPASLSPSTPNVVLPHRDAAGFASLPLEQGHSEQFANAHLHNVQRGLGGRMGARMDYLFGPVVFHASMARWWLEYGGALWDAQIVPYIEAVHAGEGRVASVEVDYRHPEEQTREEEGVEVWSAKRYMQLQVVVPALEKAFKAGAAKAGTRDAH